MGFVFLKLVKKYINRSLKDQKALLRFHIYIYDFVHNNYPDGRCINKFKVFFFFLFVQVLSEFRFNII